MRARLCFQAGLCFALLGCSVPVPLVAAATAKTELRAAVADDAQALFNHFDLDHDGRLSPGEAAALSLDGDVFEALDGDHDGSLTVSEFASPQRLETLSLAFNSLGRALVAAEDVNHDGRLSWAEYQSGMLVPWPGPTVAKALADPLRASFDAADVDHLGYVTAEQAPLLVAYLLRTGYHLQQRSR
jgi:Ca2+-binding EF-hand superfamily protein